LALLSLPGPAPSVAAAPRLTDYFNREYSEMQKLGLLIDGTLAGWLAILGGLSVEWVF
jgi:hypothetical protein